MRGDAAPDSVLAQLRADVQRRREARPVTLGMPSIGSTELRVTYGTLSTDETERYMAGAKIDVSKPLTANLEVLAKACRSIEARGPDGDWGVLEDAAGPVSFDDRLTRLLAWPREGDEFRYSVRDVYDGMFGGDGFALMAHVREALEGLGLVDLEALGPDLSTGGLPTGSASPPRSG
jgi:hypothetical protein